MIDTPIYRKISQALGQLKSVFVVITNNDSNKDSINTVCEEAQSKMPGFVSEILHFDINDEAESDFLKLLQVEKTEETPLTLVINVQGIVTGKHTGIPEADNLVQDARRIIRSGCGCG